MERFLNQKVQICTSLGGIDGSGSWYKGVVTAVDDEFVCLDDKYFIVKKYILSICLK